jgi:hypothetical protein
LDLIGGWVEGCERLERRSTRRVVLHYDGRRIT